MKLPVSTSIAARPVWARRQRRMYMNINPLAPPTEAEKRDAIRVLADPGSELYAPALWHEAFSILDEAG